MYVDQLCNQAGVTSDTEAHSPASSINKGAAIPAPIAAEIFATYELFDADGGIGSTSLDAYGVCIPWSYRKTASLDAKTSTLRL
jgi:hypothetical protein